jgi:hypothetical protein
MGLPGYVADSGRLANPCPVAQIRLTARAASDSLP